MPTPAQLGYRWPAEWEPHAATWLSWPHKRASWPDAFEPIPEAFAQFVKAVARYETVHVLAGSHPDAEEDVMARAQSLVGGVPNVVLHDIPTNDAWCRDHGPTFLVGPADAPRALVDWKFDAWGQDYGDCSLDDAVPARIAALQGRVRFEPGITLEGGAIDGNGHGTILTTRTCLLDQHRNPGLGQEGNERFLRDYLGAKKVLWLKGVVMGRDDTKGHVDQLARFVGPNTVVVAAEENPDDENYEPLARTYDELTRMTDQDGRPLNVVRLPLPGPLYHRGNPEDRMPGSYCNFLIINGAVIVPQFDDPHDARALAILAELFPDRDMVGLPALDIVWGFGAFHCLSQQEPRA
ncbi:MAG: agmatine deiminase family protein [Pirellulales bacterium]